MCDPASLALAQFAITATSTVTGLGAQIAQANAEADFAEAQADQVRVATIANYDQIAERRDQEAAAAGQQAQQAQIETVKAVETARTAAGEAGVSGLSVDALLADLYGQGAKIADGVNVNLENTNRSLDVAAENVARGGQSQINSIARPSSPNYAGAGIKIAGAGVDLYGRLRTP